MNFDSMPGTGVCIKRAKKILHKGHMEAADDSSRREDALIEEEARELLDYLCEVAFNEAACPVRSFRGIEPWTDRKRPLFDTSGRTVLNVTCIR